MLGFIYPLGVMALALTYGEAWFFVSLVLILAEIFVVSSTMDRGLDRYFALDGWWLSRQVDREKKEWSRDWWMIRKAFWRKRRVWSVFLFTMMLSEIWWRGDDQVDDGFVLEQVGPANSDALQRDADEEQGSLEKLSLQVKRGQEAVSVSWGHGGAGQVPSGGEGIVQSSSLEGSDQWAMEWVSKRAFEP